MHILLTRPLEDCSEMIIEFKSLGHQVSHLPLLNIEKIDYEQINFSNYKGIIFTSANAVKYLDHKNIDKNLLCFCVGSATEKKARSAGFQNVIAAEGNVGNLKELILQNFDQKDGQLIYISGETISVDLDQQLTNEGYSVKRIVNYKTIYNQKFDDNFVRELMLKIPDMVYIYSQNSASSFLNFIKINQSESLWMNTNLMCI
ncbi:uroporphyrinogen-III synthase, partial [Candidatus Pelagibacter sp.]|nr:uroporphyrinogen-III synthase [Candidatus Pelagibacter sp.]